MIVDRYDPMNLFEMVPKLELEFEPELVELDRLLKDDELFELVKADLLNNYLKRTNGTDDGTTAGYRRP
jgi:transposase, IS5 family